MNEQTRRGIWPIALIALITFLALPVGARPLSLLPADAVLVGDGPMAVSKRSQTVADVTLAAVSAGRADEALYSLRTIDSVLEFEQSAAMVIERLQAGADSDEARTVLLGLAETSTRVFMRHEETASDWFVPVFSIGERARSAIRLLDMRREIDRWEHQLIEDPLAALRTLNQSARGVDSAAAAVAALQTKEAIQLGRRLQSDRSTATPSAVAREIALKTADVYWFEYVAEHGTAQDQLTLIARSDVLPDEQAVEWLVAMADRTEVASAAVIALSKHADAGSVALTALIDALDQQALGPSAAAALARRPQADRIELLAQLSRSDELSPRALGRVALALRLEGSGPATELLGVLSRRDALPDAVRQELLR